MIHPIIFFLNFPTHFLALQPFPLLLCILYLLIQSNPHASYFISLSLSLSLSLFLFFVLVASHALSWRSPPTLTPTAAQPNAEEWQK